MPTSRRQVARNHQNVPGACSPSTVKFVGEDGDGYPYANLLIPPKHVKVPDIPVDSNVVFELMMFIFSVVCLSLQYINLYKTVWWLPQSNATYALNFYLIDPYLVSLLSVIMSRRFIWCLLNELTVSKAYGNIVGITIHCLKIYILMTLVLSLMWLCYHVLLRHSLLYCLLLHYPLILYIVLFQLNIAPFFGRQLLLVALPGEKYSKTQSRVYCPKESTYHSCGETPDSIREEADLLKTDFNTRIKQVLFNSMLGAYYVGFVPLCFAQNIQDSKNCDLCLNTLHYDTWWVGQQVVLTWLSSFTMFMVHFLPAKYLDVLHCCSLHLGSWTKVESRNVLVPILPWSELQIFPKGVTVKHVKGLFKAEGMNNSAEPGNSIHSRFFFMFHKPLRVTNWLLLLTSALIVYQFYQLIRAVEWSHILCLAFLLFCSYYMLYKLFRDRLILKRVHTDNCHSH